jgi:hypothetical protein
MVRTNKWLTSLGFGMGRKSEGLRSRQGRSIKRRRYLSCGGGCRSRWREEGARVSCGDRTARLYTHCCSTVPTRRRGAPRRRCDAAEQLQTNPFSTSPRGAAPIAANGPWRERWGHRASGARSAQVAGGISTAAGTQSGGVRDAGAPTFCRSPSAEPGPRAPHSVAASGPPDGRGPPTRDACGRSDTRAEPVRRCGAKTVGEGG